MFSAGTGGLGAGVGGPGGGVGVGTGAEEGDVGGRADSSHDADSETHRTRANNDLPLTLTCGKRFLIANPEYLKRFTGRDRTGLSQRCDAVVSLRRAAAGELDAEVEGPGRNTERWELISDDSSLPGEFPRYTHLSRRHAVRHAQGAERRRAAPHLARDGLPLFALDVLPSRSAPGAKVGEPNCRQLEPARRLVARPRGAPTGSLRQPSSSSCRYSSSRCRRAELPATSTRPFDRATREYASVESAASFLRRPVHAD